MARLLMTVVAVSVAVGSTAYAGGPPPMYVVVEKVVLEPSAGSAERITIKGSFIRQKERGTDYGKPVEGYVSFSLDKDRASPCRTEWRKWEKTAGTGKVVAVGMCGVAGSFLTAKIHESGERAAAPDTAYTPGHFTGIDPPVGGNWSDQPPVNSLLSFVKDQQARRASSGQTVRP